MEQIPYDELLGWYDYLERRPPGWREDDRASKIIQSAGVKEKPWVLFPSLKAIYQKPTRETENPVDTLKGSFLFHMMMTATGGDKVDL